MRFNLPEAENKILKFWKEKKIFEKTLKKTKKGRSFVFFEGPPFANGLPGIHHLLARAFKDIILRYKTMQGFYVERKAGWDTHGLPTEMAAEKSLNIKSKKEIEKLGVDKFIAECEKNVFTYKKEWEDFTERIGFWLDLKNPYITCSNEYMESLWWILKQIADKGLLYEDYKVVPYCPRCGTSLSSHEVAQGYKNVEENSVYVKFRLKEEKNTYFLVWTTTPWTLPANVALAVNNGIDYVKVKVGSEYFILAEKRLSVLDNYDVVEKYKGKDLAGIDYEPLFEPAKLEKKVYYIISADFVSLEEGTGIVHMAPAFGEDDMEAGKKNNLPVLMTVDEEGRFLAGEWKGLFVKNADPLIIENLKKRGLLFKEEMYKHDYPFCWRCKSPLLYYAKTSWFIRVTGIKKELIENSQSISWEPEYIKKGRFGEWLKEVKDWNLSRERYWGTPLPVWRCQDCKEVRIIESIKELEKLSGKKVKNLHRPFIDEITFKCDKCGKIMKRVPEVVDCWFDSGSMPFGQWHYPFENKSKIDKMEYFPADFISEAIDQTRGWFYTLLAVSTLLGRGAPYKNVICLGLVLDESSQKMSKSRGNIIKPKDVIDKFGADAARMYFYSVNQAAEPKRFDFKDVESLYRKLFDTIWQCNVFFSTYSSSAKPGVNSKNVLDRWIISKTENLNKKVIENLDKYDVVSAARLFLDFADDLSNWYVRRSRDRFKGSDKEAPKTLYYVLLKLSLLLAPFVPFFAEELYKGLKGKKESVHLDDYPKPDKKLIDEELEESMIRVRESAAWGLAKRAEANRKVRQPLSLYDTVSPSPSPSDYDEELLELIKDELNVEKVVANKKKLEDSVLNTDLTEELKQKGVNREWVRNVNRIRKKEGFTIKDVAIIDTSSNVTNLEELKNEVKAKEINLRKNIDGGEEIEINGEKSKIRLTRAK
jgi:isoleucyl-tRNA synthetase